MADQQNTRTNTSTHIRTLMSEDSGYITIKFYNTNLSFSFVPFSGKDANGRNQYNQAKSMYSTMNWESAALLQVIIQGIMNDKYPQGIQSVISHNPTSDVIISIDRRADGNTFLLMSKGGETIPFKFKATTVQDKVVENGLFVLERTLDGYLTGINAERHLNKMTDEYAKLQEGKSQNNGGYQSGGGNNYQGGYQKKNNNYQRRNYNNQSGGYNNNSASSTPAPWDPQANQAISMDSYSPPQ